MKTFQNINTYVIFTLNFYYYYLTLKYDSYLLICVRLESQMFVFFCVNGMAKFSDTLNNN